MPLLPAAAALGVYGGIRLHEALNRPRRLRRRLMDAGRARGRDRSVSEPVATDATSAKRLARRRRDLSTGTWALSLCVGAYALPALTTAALALTIVSMLPLLRETERSLRAGQVRDDLVSSTLCIASLALNQPLAAAVQSWVFHVGEVAVLRSRDRARRLLADAVPPPVRVRLLRDGAEHEVAVAEVHPGEIALLRAGDITPVDGQVLEGALAVDQHQLTGELRPHEAGPGDAVYAGSLVLRGSARIEISLTGRDTAIERVRRILRRSADHHSRLQLRVEQIADAGALPLLAASAATLPLIGPSAAVAILFSAPINSVQAAGAIATSNHLAALIGGGILIKDGRALEALADVDTVLFDKTGTLTADDLTVADVTAVGDWAPRRILATAAAAEGRFTHPLARAVLAAASDATGALPLPVATGNDFHVGHGVSAVIDGQQIRFGSQRLLSSAGIRIDPHSAQHVAGIEQRGASAILLAADARLQGIIAIEAVPRPEAAAVIDALRAHGIAQIALVSGDSAGPTRALAAQLGLHDCFSQVLPEEKAALVRRLQADGRRVCFIGDGVNDALAMRQAHCAISLHGAAAVATDTAGIILLAGDLTRLPLLFAATRAQQAHLRRMLTYWGSYAVVNTALNVGLRLGVLPSSLLFGAAFAVGLRQARAPQSGPPTGACSVA